MELNKKLDNHEHMVGRSWDICSLLAQNISGIIAVLSGDVVNPLFFITLMIFVNGLPRDFCDGIKFIATSLN